MGGGVSDKILQTNCAQRVPAEASRATVTHAVADSRESSGRRRYPVSHDRLNPECGSPGPGRRPRARPCGRAPMVRPGSVLSRHDDRAAGVPCRRPDSDEVNAGRDRPARCFPTVPEEGGGLRGVGFAESLAQVPHQSSRRMDADLARNEYSTTSPPGDGDTTRSVPPSCWSCRRLRRFTARPVPAGRLPAALRGRAS
jgi:hypothetical protein